MHLYNPSKYVQTRGMGYEKLLWWGASSLSSIQYLTFVWKKKSPHLALCDMSKWAHKLVGQMLMRVNLIGNSGLVSVQTQYIIDHRMIVKYKRMGAVSRVCRQAKSRTADIDTKQWIGEWLKAKQPTSIRKFWVCSILLAFHIWIFASCTTHTVLDRAY